MAVTELRLERFGPFGKAEIPLVDGVNVVLGANSTGKTFALKGLYSLLKALSDESRPAASARELVRDKFAGVFQPDEGGIHRLIHRTPGKGTARVELEFDDRERIRLTLSSSKNAVAYLGDGQEQLDPGSRPISDTPVLYLPSREVLAMYEGFVAAYSHRELSFDETFFDTAVALSASALKGPRPGSLRKVVDRLEDSMNGRIRLEGPRFYLRERSGGRLEAHLMAEGLRKVATIVHLVANGTLRQGGILIWDEPEANLHPSLVEVVVECLGALANGGVQVILATHDFLMADAISRWSEYPKASEYDVPTQFVQLRRTEDDVVEAQSAQEFSNLEYNPLLMAFLDHHDREQRMIIKDLGVE